MPSDPEEPFRYVHSANVPGLLETLRATLLVTTYQVGKLAAFRAAGGRVSMLLRTFDKAMGLAATADRMALGTRYQVWFLRNDRELATRIPPDGRHDACYVPRRSHVTGDIQVHELAWAGDELWIVNTRFSCLCTLDAEHSFVPRWRPPFVSQLAPEDRCHLNGLALVDGQPKYVTILGESDAPRGWRPEKANGGCLLDVPSGEIAARGLSMPHSPRWHGGRLWLLDSGTGRLVTVDTARGKVETVAELPGFTRGLALAGGYAFVGLSKIRETAIFGGLPIAAKFAELKCGVWIVELASGQIAGHLEFDRSVEEIFDVQLLPGIGYPAILGLQKESIQQVFQLP
jgi:uncharacterized protein (TIGR03032 family)